MSGVTISDDQTMEPIDLSKVPSSKHNKMCTICKTSKGYCSTCSVKKCKNTFHITCAQSEKTLQEDVNPATNRITFKSFCMEHKPLDSTRRLSSGSVEEKVKEKRAKSTKNESAVGNADWIMRSIGAHSTPAKKENTKPEPKPEQKRKTPIPESVMRTPAKILKRLSCKCEIM